MKQKVHPFKVLALALILAGVAASCGSSKRCDCPSFGIEKTSEKPHV